MADNGQPPDEVQTPAQNNQTADEREGLLRQIRERDERIAVLEQSAAEREKGVGSLKEAASGSEKRLADTVKELTGSVEAYRALIIELNPGMLAELITGNTIAEIKESLKSARALIERVRQDIEAKAAATKVPSGAPRRSAPDLSGLSAREKIHMAIGGNK